MAHGFFSETPLYVFILVLSQVIAPLRSRAAVTSCLSTLVINRQELSVTDLEVSEDKEAFGRGSRAQCSWSPKWQHCACYQRMVFKIRVERKYEVRIHLCVWEAFGDTAQCVASNDFLYALHSPETSNPPLHNLRENPRQIKAQEKEDEMPSGIHLSGI